MGTADWWDIPEGILGLGVFLGVEIMNNRANRT